MIRECLTEDADDLKAFRARADEPVVDYETMLEDLWAHGKLRIVFKRSVAKDLRSIPKKDVQRILRCIDGLADDPRPVGAEKLSGEEKHNIRQGSDRFPYAIEDDVVTVTIVVRTHLPACKFASGARSAVKTSSQPSL